MYCAWNQMNRTARSQDMGSNPDQKSVTKKWTHPSSTGSTNLARKCLTSKRAVTLVWSFLIARNKVKFIKIKESSFPVILMFYLNLHYRQIHFYIYLNPCILDNCLYEVLYFLLGGYIHNYLAGVG